MSNYKHQVSFSLILPTLGRSKELNQLFSKLLKTINKDLLEIIVIDQNEKTFGLDKICKSYSSQLNIIYIHSDIKGLSINRNIGLKYAKGDFIIFTDDDCYYDLDFFKIFIKNHIKNNDTCAYISSALNIEDGDFYTHKPNVNNLEQIKLKNYKSIISLNIILSNKVIDIVGGFDECFGIGAKYGACEESDLIIRLFSKKIPIYFLNNCKVYHPSRKKNYLNFTRSRNYALGFGAFFKKQILINNSIHLKLFFINEFLKINLISFFGIILFLFSKKRKHYLYALKYKLIGFFQYNLNK